MRHPRLACIVWIVGGIVGAAPAASPDLDPRAAYDDLRGQVLVVEGDRILINLGMLDGLFIGKAHPIDLRPGSDSTAPQAGLDVIGVGLSDASVAIPAGVAVPQVGDPVRFRRPRPHSTRSAPVNELIGRRVTLRMAGDQPGMATSETRSVRVMSVKAVDVDSIASFTAVRTDSHAPTAFDLETFSTAKVAAVSADSLVFVVDPASGNLVERGVARSRGVPPIRQVDPTQARILVDVRRRQYALAGVGVSQEIRVNGILLGAVGNGMSARFWVPSHPQGTYRVEVGLPPVTHEFRSVPSGTVLSLATSLDPGRQPNPNLIESPTTIAMSWGMLRASGDPNARIAIAVNQRLDVIEPGEIHVAREWGEPKRPVRFEVLLGNVPTRRRVAFALNEVVDVPDADSGTPPSEIESLRRSVLYLKQLRLALAFHLAGALAVETGFPVEALAKDLSDLSTVGVQPRLIQHRDRYIQYTRDVELIRTTTATRMAFDGAKGVAEGALDSLVMGSTRGEAAIEGLINLTVALFGSNAEIRRQLAAAEQSLRQAEAGLLRDLRTDAQAHPELADDPPVQTVLLH